MEKRILKHVNIDSSVNEYDRQLLAGYQESLARYVHKHNLAVNFSRPEGSNKT